MSHFEESRDMQTMLSLLQAGAENGSTPAPKWFADTRAYLSGTLRAEKAALEAEKAVLVTALEAEKAKVVSAERERNDARDRTEKWRADCLEEENENAALKAQVAGFVAKNKQLQDAVYNQMHTGKYVYIGMFDWETQIKKHTVYELFNTGGEKIRALSDNEEETLIPKAVIQREAREKADRQRWPMNEAEDRANRAAWSKEDADSGKPYWK